MSKTLKIALDCRDLHIATTGTKTYLTELIAALKTLQHTAADQNFDSDFDQNFDNNFDQNFELVLIEPLLGVMPGNSALSKLIRHFQFFWWKQITLPILAFFKGADILICTDYVAPIITPGFKTMVVFHDAFFWEYPQHYSRGWLRIFKWFALRSASKSISVIAPSEYAKKQIVHYTGIPATKMSVVYEAPKTFAPSQSQTKSQAPAPAQQQLQITAPYFLHVGTLAKHKNLVTLIEAFALLVQKSSIDPTIKLVLVGGAPSSVHSNDEPNIKAAIQKHNLQNRVVLTGYVSSNAVANWYSGAIGYVFPSRNEGFGLPMLEAMCYQLPIIAANNTCLPEIGQAAALYFDPNNAPQIAVLLEAIVNNDPSVIASVNAQHIVLQQFSWQKTANQFIQIAAKGLNNAPKHA